MYALTRERDALRREQSRKSDAAALLKEKDEIISQVMAEGKILLSVMLVILVSSHLLSSMEQDWWGKCLQWFVTGVFLPCLNVTQYQIIKFLLVLLNIVGNLSSVLGLIVALCCLNLIFQ